MSTLSQFLPAGDSFVGEIISGPASVWGGNPTFSGKEYLRTGLLKTYSSNYSGLLSALPTACVASGQIFITGSNWNLSGPNTYAPYGIGLTSVNIYDLGGNKHVVYLADCGRETNMGGAVRYAASFSATADASEMPLQGDQSTGAGTYSSILFKNAIYVSGYRPTNYSASFGAIWRSTGTTYTATYNGTVIDQLYMAASPNRLVAINYTNITQSYPNSIGYTDNGTTWTQAAPSTSLQYPNRFCWSTAGNCFIVVRHDGVILTSPDGFTWTTRTAPANMPTSVASTPRAPHVADTPSATYIMLGSPNASSTYILKTTDGVNFTLVDLADSGNLIGLFTGTAGAVPNMFYDGTRLIIHLSGLQAYSTNGGVSWILDTMRVQTVLPSYTGVVSPFLYNGSMYTPYFAPSNWGRVTASELISFAGRSFGAAPQSVGMATAQTLASGTSLSTYLRIK